MTADAFWGGVAGSVGTVLVMLVRWLLTRGEREARLVKSDARQQQMVDDSSAKLATQLRDEMRVDNNELRSRLREAEAKGISTEARVNDLLKTNATLHQDNLELTEKNGVLTERTETQASQIKRLTEQVQAQGAQITELQADRLILIDAMRAARITIPPLTAERKPVTGPLGKGA